MGESQIAWIITGLVIVALLIIVLVLRRERRRSRERATETAAAHRDELVRTDASHQRELLDRDADVQRAEDERDRFRRAATRRIEWELVSRDGILAACEQLGLDGVLATNVTFIPPVRENGEVFLAQVDHVLVTERGALVIENKHWAGAVFDGRKPSQVSESWRTLVHDAEVGDSDFAVQVVRGDSSLRVRIQSGAKSPRAQVRRQAQRLHDLVQQRLGRDCWFDTSVFYSHPGAHVYASATGATDVAGSLDALVALIRARVAQWRSRTDPYPAVEIAQLFAELGADVAGFGSAADRWQSDYRGIESEALHREARERV